MKKRLLFTLLATYFSSITFGQVIDELPTDENGKINFNEVVVIDSVSAPNPFAGVLHRQLRRFHVGEEHQHGLGNPTSQNQTQKT